MKKCLLCDNSIPQYNKFCNRSCAAKYNNRSRYVAHFCEYCKIEIMHKNKCVRIYCSNKCQQLAAWDIIKAKIRETGIANYVRTAKRYLVDEFGHKCQICSLDKWMEQPIPLILDHINGNPMDNRLINLRLVCGNCDMMLPTYKGRNRGNGRYARRQRRAEGKSY